MCDGVLLLVDSVEGAMPQTRFVLGKSLELQKKVVVVINKIDRPAARPEWVLDTTFDLFCDLGASDEQCEFPVVYASGLAGKAGLTAELEDTLEPLFETIVKSVRYRCLINQFTLLAAVRLARAMACCAIVTT
jgi:GTP-binding protein